jgi:hypothetical protein
VIIPSSFKNYALAGCWWLMPVILVTQEAEIRRILVQSHPRQIVGETLSRKTLHKNRAGGVARSEDPKFKPQYHKKRTMLWGWRVVECLPRKLKALTALRTFCFEEH